MSDVETDLTEVLEEGLITEIEEIRNSILFLNSQRSCLMKRTTKSKNQAVKDYLNAFGQKAAAYDSPPMYVSGTFSHDKDAPINNWLQNSVQNMSNDTTKLPTDWMQVLEVNADKEWPLLYSLSTESFSVLGTKRLQSIVISYNG